MANFILRQADDELWAKFRERAQREGRTLRWTVLALIAYYTKHGLPTPPEKAKR